MSKDDEFGEWAGSAVPQLLRMARVLLAGDGRYAEDLVQDALVSVYVKWSKVENADAFARKCLTNKFISSRRSPSFRKEDLWADMPDDRTPLSTSPRDVTDSIRDGLQLLGSLSKQQRTVVALRYLDDMPFEEIAEVLDISEGTVKKHLTRALSALRKVNLQHDHE